MKSLFRHERKHYETELELEAIEYQKNQPEFMDTTPEYKDMINRNERIWMNQRNRIKARYL